MITEYACYIVPLELEGAELPLCKVAVQHLLTPKGRHVHLHVCTQQMECNFKQFNKFSKSFNKL